MVCGEVVHLSPAGIRELAAAEKFLTSSLCDLHPWPTPAHLLRLRSEFASLVRSPLTAGRGPCTLLAAHPALSHWAFSSYASVSTTGLGGSEDRDCALLIFVSPGLSTGSGQNNKG